MKEFKIKYENMICKTCGNSMGGKYRTKQFCSYPCTKKAQYQRNKEKILIKFKYKYHNDKEYRQRMLNIRNKSRIKNREQINERNRDFRKNNHELLSEKQKDYYKKNKESILASNKRYRQKYSEKERTRYLRYKFMYPERYKEKMIINARRFRNRNRIIINEQRKQEGLPLIGEGGYYESKFKKLLDKLIVNHNHYDNHYWKSVNGKLTNGCSRYNGLQLDRYYPDYNLAFEYDGRQHFMFVQSFHKSEREFIAMKERDKRKEEMCKESRIKLIRVNYKEKITQDLILQKLSEVNIQLDDP